MDKNLEWQEPPPSPSKTRLPTESVAISPSLILSALNSKYETGLIKKENEKGKQTE